MINNSKQSQIDITKLKALDNSITVTVGTGGNFTTINQAINYLMEYRPTKIGVKATILLLTGFVAKEQLTFIDIDCSWIQIDSTDSGVVIDRQMLTNIYDNKNYFLLGINSKLPTLNVLFNMNTTGTTTSAGFCGLLLYKCSNAIICTNKGFKNVSYVGVWLFNASNLSADNCIITGCGYNVYLNSASRASLNSANLTGAVNHGMAVNESSNCCAINANTRRGVTDSFSDTLVTNGGILTFTSSTGGVNITVNTLSSYGIIFK